eukprot:COSAG06_NODE_38281_length_425_cov_0.901840_1_plen_74_part_00
MVHLVRSFALLAWLVGCLPVWPTVWLAGWLAGCGWLWLVVAYRRRRSSSARAALECAARFIFEESASRNVNAA